MTPDQIDEIVHRILTTPNPLAYEFQGVPGGGSVLVQSQSSMNAVAERDAWEASLGSKTLNTVASELRRLAGFCSITATGNKNFSEMMGTAQRLDDLAHTLFMRAHAPAVTAE